MDVNTASRELPPEVFLRLMADAITTLQKFTAEGYFHGDIKSANILFFQDKSGNWVFRIIDNTPVPSNKAIGVRYSFTPWFAPDGSARLYVENQMLKAGKNYEEVDSHLCRAMDAFAFGRMIERTFGPIADRVAISPAAKAALDRHFNDYSKRKKAFADKKEFFFLDDIPKIPETGNAALDNLINYLNRSRDLMQAGDPGFMKGFADSFRKLQAEVTGGAVSTHSETPDSYAPTQRQSLVIGNTLAADGTSAPATMQPIPLIPRTIPDAGTQPFLLRNGTPRKGSGNGVDRSAPTAAPKRRAN